MSSAGFAFDGQDFDAVLFDLDGTLISSIAAVERCWRQWAGEFGLPGAESFELPQGAPAIDVVRDLIPAADVERAFARIVELEIHDTDGVQLLPGAQAALAAIPPAQQAIVTSCTAALAQARIRATGVQPPRVLVTADDVERGKPHPEPFQRAAALLGVDPTRCLAVEDAPTGLASASAAGCATLAVAGAHLPGELEADAQVRDLGQVRFEVADGAVRVRLSQ